MKKILLTIVCATGLVVLSRAEVKSRIQGLKEASIHGNRITLASVLKTSSLDEAQHKRLETVFLGAAPPPGKSKLFGRDEILRHLEEVGLNSGNCLLLIPEEIRVSRASQIWTLEDVTRRIEEKFLPILPWRDVNVKEVEWVENVVLPAGETEVTFDCPPRTNYAVPFYLGLNISVDGEVIRRLFLRIRLVISEVVAVASVPLSPKDDLTSEKIRWEKQQLTSLLHLPIRNETALAGKRLRHSIPAGTLLTENMLYSAPLVKRGDEVRLVYLDQNLKVATTVKSLGSGSQGDRIKVMNMDSKKELLAEIVDSKTVRTVF